MRTTRLAIERLEERGLLAGYDLSSFGLHQSDTRLPGPRDAALDDTSGVAYVADSAGNRIFVVRNEPTAIYEYRLSGDRPPSLLRSIELTGLMGPDRRRGGDTEGIVYLGRTDAGEERFAVVEERIGHIQTFAVSPKTAKVDRSDMKSVVPKSNPANGRNDGLEGITFRPGDDAAGGSFYVVKEAGEKMGVWRVAMDGETTEVEVTDRAGKRLDKIVKDLADLHFAMVEGAPTLFVLSQEDARILKIKLEGDGEAGERGTVIAQRNLAPDFAREAKYAEGIVFSPDGREMIVVGEPAEIFHCRIRETGEKGVESKCSTARGETCGGDAVDAVFAAGLAGCVGAAVRGFGARRRGRAGVLRRNGGVFPCPGGVGLSATGNCKMKIGNWKLEIGDWKSEIGNCWSVVRGPWLVMVETDCGARCVPL
jgi:uncharacterized protein YjiK